MSAGFPELVAVIQVGTRKSPVVRATDFPLEGTERTALLELGTLGLRRRAGVVGGSAMPVPVAAPETMRVALKAAEPLAEALDGRIAAALEWATLARERGFVAPPAVVADLLRLAPKHPGFLPVLGGRGRWLAELNGVSLRFENPPLPEGDFESLGWEDRLTRVVRSPQDEPLLQKGLTDRKREVREAAAQALVRLPGSPQARMLRETAERVVTVHRSFLRTTLDVEPPSPDELPKWLPRSFARTGVGERAHALRDLVAHVPPTVWGRSPEDLLALAQKTEYAAALGDGWGDAALRFDDQAWIDALFRTPHEIVPHKNRFAARASTAIFDGVTIPLLRNLTRNEGPSLVLSRHGACSPELSRAVVEAGSRGAISSYTTDEIAFRLDLSVLPLLETPWDDAAAEDFRLRSRSILDLRRRLHESLR